MVHLIGRRPRRPPQRRRQSRVRRPADPHPGGFHIVLTLPANFNPDRMFDTSDSVQAAKTARAQTASAVAVVADTTPRAATAPSRALPDCTPPPPSTASCSCLVRRSFAGRRRGAPGTRRLAGGQRGHAQLAKRPRRARGSGRRGHRRRAHGRPPPHVVGQAFAAHRLGGYRLSTWTGRPFPQRHRHVRSPGRTASNARVDGLFPHSPRGPLFGPTFLG